METWQIIVVITTLLSIMVVIFVCLFLHERYKKFVLSNSDRLKNLLSLNKITKFHEDVLDYYYFTQALNSKRKLDNTSIHDFFLTLIERDYENFKTIKNKITENIQKNNIYISKCNAIKSTITQEDCKKFRTRYKKFIRYEKSLFRNLLLSPVVNTKIVIELTYTSPQGRNHYSKSDIYYFSSFAHAFEKQTSLINQKKTQQYQIQIERSKMTDSLRYDILKRDNFRCQICGATANDGLRLHVDHIIPVSKGGKTIESNLRTLCERCNLGKSNKI